MTELNQIYKCGICGNIVEMVHPGAGQLVCCGQPMDHQAANTQDASLEKHVPVIEAVSSGFRISVGSAAHPMEEKHFIEWIEIVADGEVCRKYLKPGDAPVVGFSGKAAQITARAYCNVHGLWIAKA